VTAKALRNLRPELTVEEFLLLDRMPGAGHAVPARLHCELEHEHRGDHFAFAQTGEGASSSSAVWWMRWNAAGRDVVDLAYCLARDPGWPEDQDEDDPMFCGLPADHRAAHEWEMRSGPQFTRTANGVSELGKDRLRAVPAAAGPQLRIHRYQGDHRGALAGLAALADDLAARVPRARPGAPPGRADRVEPALARRGLRRLAVDRPRLPPHRDVPKLTRAVREELRRAAASIGQMLDGIEAYPWRR
jgi:hypothetical protein